MKKVNVILFIIVIIVICILGVFIFLNEHKVSDDYVEIPGVSFTLNDIKNEFLRNDAVKKDKCNVTITGDNFNIKCKSGEYQYHFIEGDLEVTTNKNGFDIYKYLVDSIQVLHGAKRGEYYDTLDRFLAGEILVKGLKYNTIDNKEYLGINTTEMIEKYIVSEVIKDEEIRPVTSNNLEYQSGENKLTNITFDKSEKSQSYVFYSRYVGDDYTNKVLNIKFYDDSNNIIEEKDVKLSDFTSRSENYLDFLFEIELGDNYNNVSNFSINMK